MPNHLPYGNAFLVDTPEIDRLHATLYNEQKSRDLQRQRDVTALDDEFTKNVANIKDADVDDLTAAYNDYKQSTQQLMRQKGGANPQQQLALLRKKAAMYKLINESKQEKEDIKLLGKAITSDTKGIYDTAAAARLAARLKTPTSKYGSYTEVGADGKSIPVDLRDANGYLYKLGASDFSKDFDAARGKDRDLTPDDKTVDPADKLNFVQKQYKGKNNAIEFYTNLLPRIAGSKESKDFVLRTDIDYPPEKAAALEARYKQLVNDPAYRRKYGLKDNDEIPLSSYDSPVARAVRLRAMEHAVNSPIIEKVEKIIPNKSAVMDRTEKFKIDQQARGAVFSMARLDKMIANRQLPWMNATERADFIINRDTEEGGTTTDGVVQTDAIKYKTLTGTDYTSTSQLRSDGNGGYVYGKTDGDGKFIQKGSVSSEEAKDRLIKTAPKNPIPSSNTKTGGEVIVVLQNGKKGKIPSNQVDKFLKDNPGSKRQ